MSEQSPESKIENFRAWILSEMRELERATTGPVPILSGDAKAYQSNMTRLATMARVFVTFDRKVNGN